MTQYTLRPYQERLRDNVRAAFRADRRRVLIVSPTGSGKTVTVADIVRSSVSKGNRVLVISHTKEIIEQTSAKLDTYDVPHGVMMGSHWRCFPDLLVQVGSIQTLVRRPALDPPPNLIFVDEAHHARASTYGRVLDQYPRAPVIGATASPWRSDGKGLGELFQSLVVAATPAELIAQGYLVHYGGFSFEHPDLNGVKMRGRDYDPQGLELACSKARIVGGIVDQWKLHAGGVRTILFAAGIAHSRLCVEAFRSAGISAEHLDGTTPKMERSAILARLAAGATRVICNVGVLTEGWDCPAAACCILACPTKSLVRYLQQVGRVLRPFPGKTQALIHDHAGLLLQFGLPDEERDYGLTSDLEANARPPAIVRCPPPCGRIYLNVLPACPECGRANPHQATVSTASQEREVEELRDARMVAIDEIREIRNVSLKTKAAEYKRLLAFVARKGWKKGTAWHMYRSTFGEDPMFSRAMLDSVPVPTHPCIDLHRLRAAEAKVRAGTPKEGTL